MKDIKVRKLYQILDKTPDYIPDRTSYKIHMYLYQTTITHLT